jgi:hypothetical protein
MLPDGKPGHYYVTVRSHGGKVAFAAGPFTQSRPGTLAHRQALGCVRHVRRIVERTYRDRDTAFSSYGTARIPLELEAPVCVLDRHGIAWRGEAV